ncbi:unnamed protein product [Candida verbasci]|uniref:Major facilitator superfamily (MFS) profile domain-containing protein n=1 Tax=Candida verbasci TaxID=1227364 RepID=A0A9W4TS98_9ASCO|nr:unnamed protein product [Candida verbasci]
MFHTTSSSASIIIPEPQRAYSFEIKHNNINNEEYELHNILSYHQEDDISIRPFQPDSKSKQVDDVAFSQYEPLEGSNNDNLRRRRNSEVSIRSQGSMALMYGSDLNTNIPDGGLKAYLVLIGSFFGLIADFGIANSLGAIESYISDHQLNDISTNKVGWIFSLHLGIMYFGGVFFGELFDKLGAKIPLVAGTLIMCVGLVLTAECEKLYQFILSFSVVTAIGTSVAMSPLIGSLSHWFLKKRALACSVATCGGLVGASIFAVMLQRLYEQIGFKNAIRILACLCFFCMSLSVVLVKERKDESLHQDLDNAEVEKKNKVRHVINFFKSALDFKVVNDQKFISLTIAVFLAEIVSMTSLTYLGSYALVHGISNSESYLLLTIVNVCGIPSRIFSGFIADKFGRFNVMIITSILTTIVIFALWLPAKDNSRALLISFSVLFGITTSSVISLIGACVGQICSSSNFGKVYGVCYFFLGFLTILGMYATSAIIGSGSKQNYTNFVYFEGALSAFSVIAWLWARYACVGFKWCKF